MLIAASFGMAPVVPIQAGVSAVLVLALGPQSAGLTRMEDVAIGVVVGLTFSQVLLTPDPVREIDAAADDLLLGLAKAFRDAAGALQAHDVRKAEVSLKEFSTAHDSLIALGAGIDAARYAARWSLRGRLAARTVAEATARYDRRAIRLYASALLFGEALANALRKGVSPVPAGLAPFILDIAARCTRLANGSVETDVHDPASETSGPTDWRSTIDHLRAVSDVLATLEDINRPLPINTPAGL